MSSQQILHAWCYFILGLAACSGSRTDDGTLSSEDIARLRSIEESYVVGWLEDDTLAILSLFDREAVLMPAGLRPIVGIDEITDFWWPDDGSITDVTAYTMDVGEFRGDGHLAFTRGNAELTFTYVKDGVKTEQTNSTMYLTIYRRQPDGDWRILRRMWGPLSR